MTLRDYLRVLRRRWPVLAVALIIGVTIGALVRGSPTSTARGYEATTVMLQRQLGPDEAALRPGLLSGIDTVTTLVTVGEVPRRVAERLSYQGTVAQLLDRVRAGGEKGTGLIRITAVARQPSRAEEIARTFAIELQAYLLEREEEGTAQYLVAIDERIAEMEREVNTLRGAAEGTLARTRLEAKVNNLEVLINERGRIAVGKPSTLSIIGDPEAREIADASLAIPTGVTRMAILGVLGLALGIAIVVLSERVDTRIRSREDAERAFGAPVLAEIPTLRRRERHSVVAEVKPHSPAADAFGLLAFAVSRRTASVSNGHGGGRRGSIAPILVTSASHGEGKTTVAVNVAAALAEMGLRVLLISADFRSATTHEAFRSEDPRGLSDALLGAEEGGPWLAPVVRESGVRGLRLVSSGSAPERLSELLSSDAMHRAMDEARATADVVLVDAAPILVARDAAALVGEVGSVLVVAGAEQVTRDLAESAAELLEHLGAQVIGVVLNRSFDPPAARAAGRTRLGWRGRPVKTSATSPVDPADGAANGHGAIDLTRGRQEARLGDDPSSPHGS